MVKKGTKRKTRWRTLSIGDGGTDTSDTGITEIKQEQNECLTSASNTNLSSYNRKYSPHTAPFHQRNGDRHHYFRNSDKYPSQPHTSTQSQEDNLHQNSSHSYKRRPFYQTSSSRYYGNTNNKPTNLSTNNRPYRSADTFDNKENNTTKPLFNEDDYTRITTPRQDVLFKKGYLSRPKKTIDATVSSSTTVSVVSTEDSISSGTQSLSPEHCSSTPEIFDLDPGLMYPGFYDQNGVFFVHPFPNGFDPYDGQMIMMPYGGSPFSINPTEYCNSESTPPYPPNHYQKRNSVDSENSPETPSSQNESASASSTPAIDESSNEPSQNGDAPAESQSESDGPKTEGEITSNECNHNMPMQFYYPFMYGPPPPFMPINEMEYNDNMAQYVNSYGGKYNRFRKRKRRPFKWGNSTGVSATTTDYSEDEDSIEENNRLLDQAVQQSNIETDPCLTIAQCDDVISRTTLNTNVSEFVPRHLQSSPSRTTLNVEVEEFHPRNYTPAVQSKSTGDPDSTPNDTKPKQMSPDTQKVTILHRAPTEKYSQPTPVPSSNSTSKDKAELQINKVQVSSATDKSSTLISSISSRDKNDDNVNGVDNNKKIEKLVDPVNTKADLEDKVVMHPKQQENILENVKKTKFKNTKSSKSASPRKMNNGHKKDVKIGKVGASTNGKCENVPAVTKALSAEPLEPQKNEVENRNGVGDRIEKPNQPTYAQMVGPVAKPKAITAKAEVVDHIQENVVPLSAEELKMFEVIDEIEPVTVKKETKWQTVRPKGKKKLLSAMCEEPNDEWNDFDEDKPVEVNETKVAAEPISQEIQIDEPNETAVVDGSMEPPTPASKIKPPKTEKVKLKSKAKKSQKKIKEKTVKPNGVADTEATEPNGTSTPKNDKTKSKTLIIDDLFVDDGHEFLDDIDISNFNFETSPSMFVNAITNSGIYTDNAMTGKPNAGFALNNSLKLLNTFDFCKTKENVLLKEEEEMVIRVMKSLNQQDHQIVKDDVSRCIKIIDDVKLNNSCEDVKIEENIIDVVNGHNDTHNGNKNEVNGAEIFVKCELNGKSDGIDNDTKENEFPLTNGHQIEDTKSKYSESETVDPNQTETDSKIELIPNGTNGHQIEVTRSFDSEPETVDQNQADTNLKIEPISNGTNGHHIRVTKSSDSELETVDENQTEKIDPISNGSHLMAEPNPNANGNGEETDVSAHAIMPCDIDMSINHTNDLDVTKVANKTETEKNDGEITDQTLFEVEEINKDCNSNIKYDDEAHSDLSELSDENDETIVSRSIDCFENDEIETIKEIDVTELIEDLQFDDDAEDFGLGNEDDKNIRTNESVPERLENVMIQEISLEDEHLPSTNIFIEHEADILKKTEITINDEEEEENHSQERIQSPRNSEDSGILEYQDDGRYFSESEQPSITSFPLTEAVSRWLEEKQKEKSPEPLIRLPDDPELSQRIEKSIKNRLHISQFFDDYEDDEVSDESETEFEVEANTSKNLMSNPLRVLFRRKNTTTSNHSSTEAKNGNQIRKRVANQNLESDKSSVVTVDEPDILEFWENDPMLQSQKSNVLNDNDDDNCSIESGLEAYESVYGKTIDYANLSANIHNDDDVFLSNNIRNNDKLSKVPIQPINNNTDSSLPNASSINAKDDINSNDKNLNCFKPPEICCMLM